MLTVVADLHKGNVFPEFEIEKNIDALLSKGEDFSIGGITEMAYLRALVKRKTIEPFQFKFSDEYIQVDQDGNLLSSPQGFFDKLTDYLMELF